MSPVCHHIPVITTTNIISIISHLANCRINQQISVYIRTYNSSSHTAVDNATDSHSENLVSVSAEIYESFCDAYNSIRPKLFLDQTEFNSLPSMSTPTPFLTTSGLVMTLNFLTF